MAIKGGRQVVILSDSDDDSPASPLTIVKPLCRKQSPAKRRVKRLSREIPKNQTRLDSFFQSITIKNDRNNKPNVLDRVSEQTSTGNPRLKVYTSTKLSPVRSSKATKRPAIKGCSPQTKVANKEKAKITDLQGMLPKCCL